jgi:hypothetical protein
MRLIRKKPQKRKLHNNQPRYISSNKYYRPSLKKSVEFRAEQKNVTEKSRKITFSYLINALILIVLSIILFFAFTLSGSPAIVVKESDYEYRSVNEYRIKAEQILNNDVTQKAKPFFRSSRFEEKMKTAFPEIVSINAVVPLGGRTLKIALITSSPLVAMQNGTEKGIIDDSGTIVTANSSSTSADNLPLLRLATPIDDVKLGDRILTNQEIELLTLLKKETKLRGVLLIVGEGQMEAHFSDVNYYSKLSTYSSPQLQVGALLATKRQLAGDNNQPTKYIDVRVPGRVFVQ